ncbi:MAG: hypothetical protein JST67_10520 [Bacteroidetes bacterium]|nr:hypothetical protein [Bacteroidota bacterium]
MEEITIHLLKGFCHLFFGDSPLRAETLFGKPDEIEELTDELLGEKSTVYHYFSNGFSLFFSHHTQKALNCVEVDNKEALLLGQKIFSFSEDQIKVFFKQQSFPLSETEQHPWGEKRLSFDEAFADLYFEKGKLVSINFCAPHYHNAINPLNLN